MGNVIGKVFDKYVQNQVKTRQTTLGHLSRSDKELQLLNNSTAFLRLASSVDISQNVAENLGYPNLSGKKLAQKLILWNGVSSMGIEKNVGGDTFNDINLAFNQPNTGISNGGLNGAYGFAGNQFGYRPMPALVGANTSFYNNGSLQKATIQIKAFNTKQLELIEALYMKLGYTILLEWGHTIFQDNTGEIRSFDTYNTEPLNQLFQPITEYYRDEDGDDEWDEMERDLNTDNATLVTQYTMYQAIRKTRKEYDGNYDAFYGKITYFNWSFESDGTYSISISAISMGDIIESLQSNNSMEISISKKEDKDEEKKEQPTIIANKDRSLIDKWLFEVKQEIDKNGQRKENKQNKTWGKTCLPIKIYNIKDGETGDWNVVPNKESQKNLNNLLFRVDSPYIATNYKGETDNKGENTQYYTKFGLFLRFLENNINLFNNNIPYIKFDYNFHSNYCLTLPEQISSDPKICVIPMNNPAKEIVIEELNEQQREILGEIFGKDYPDTVKKFTYKKGAWKFQSQLTGLQFKGRGVNTSKYDYINPYLGRLMHIHVNLEFISNALTESANDEGNVNLYSFLTKILKGITKSLGSINKLSIGFNSENNKLVIRENAPLRYDGAPFAEKTKGTLSKFQVYGINSEVGGSFVKSINFNVTVPSNFATMISVGAQSDGNQVSENATAFSSINTGIVDRIIPLKSTKKNKKETTIKPEESTEFIMGTNLMKIQTILENLYKKRNLNSEDINTLESLNKDYINYIVGSLSQLQTIPAPFFIPFNLQVQMNGLSGMRIFEKYIITEGILPPIYRSRLIGGKEVRVIDFLIKGIAHEIVDNKWTTTLETMAAPAEQNGPLPKQEKLPEGEEGTSSTATSPPSPQYEENPITPEEENNLKTLLVVKRIESTPAKGNYGKRIISDSSEATSLPKGQTLGEIQVLDEAGNEKFVLKSVELPYQNNQNNISSIPVGTYNIGKRTTPKRGTHFHIQNVPKRNWILIHSSNYASQLLGCIAPGKTYMVIGGKKVGVSSSKVAMGLLVDALPNKFKMEIKQV